MSRSWSSGIKNVKIFGQACFLPMGSQQAMGQAVKRAHPHAAKRLPKQLFDAAPHFPRSLVVKVTARMAKGDTFSACISQATRCTSTRVLPLPHGQHQQVAGWTGYGIALLVVQGVEYVGYIHGLIF
jgi:hypothetical protein